MLWEAFKYSNTGQIYFCHSFHDQNMNILQNQPENKKFFSYNNGKDQIMNGKLPWKNGCAPRWKNPGYGPDVYLIMSFWPSMNAWYKMSLWPLWVVSGWRSIILIRCWRRCELKLLQNWMPSLLHIFSVFTRIKLSFSTKIQSSNAFVSR